MRMYKVKTLTNLTIEIKRLFRKNKTYRCWYTTKSKFIYASNQEEAERKYTDLFFTPLKESEWDKCLLELHRWCADDKSDNMRFNLPFNYHIKSVSEVVSVTDEPIKDNIDYIRNNSTYIDFRDWFHDKQRNFLHD